MPPKTTERSPRPRGRAKLQRAWTRYQAGDVEGARRDLRRVREDAPGDRGVLGVGRLLLAQALGVRAPDLGGIERTLRSGDPPEARLLVLANYALELGRSGCPLGQQVQLLDRLAAAARVIDPRYEAALALRAARATMAAGRLAEAAARLDAIDLAGPRHAAGLLPVLRDLVGALQGRRPGRRPPPLEDLTRLEAIDAHLLVAEVRRRQGHAEAARGHLRDARRLDAPLRFPATRERVALLEANLLLDAGEADAAAARLEDLPARPRARVRAWARDLLRARGAGAAGREAEARGLLARVLPTLEEYGDRGLLDEARLLGLRLDLRHPGVRTSLAADDPRIRDLLAAEDATDPIRVALLLAAECPEEEPARAALATLGARPGRDPRVATAHALGEALREVLAGDADRARRRALALPSPPRLDVPGRALARWISLLSTKRAEDGVELLRGAPPPTRGTLRVCRGLHGAKARPLELVTPRRRIRIDSWGRERARERRPDLDLWVDRTRRECLHRGDPLPFGKHPRLLELLVDLLAHTGEWRDIDDLTRDVWEREPVAYETDRLVHTGVSRLRGILPARSWVQTHERSYRIDPEIDFVLLRAAEA